MVASYSKAGKELPGSTTQKQSEEKKQINGSGVKQASGIASFSKGTMQRTSHMGIDKKGNLFGWKELLD